MTDRVEVSKLHPTIALGSPADVLTVSKLTVYFLLEPDPGDPGDTTNQGHVYVQIVEG